MRESARLRLITVAVTLGIIFGFSLIFGSNPIMFVIGLWNIFATAFVWLFSGGIIVYAIVLAIFLVNLLLVIFNIFNFFRRKEYFCFRVIKN